MKPEVSRLWKIALLVTISCVAVTALIWIFIMNHYG
jgi:hypothetical protein